MGNNNLNNNNKFHKKTNRTNQVYNNQLYNNRYVNNNKRPMRNVTIKFYLLLFTFYNLKILYFVFIIWKITKACSYFFFLFFFIIGIYNRRWIDQPT